MLHLLSEMGRSFLRAFGASLIVLAPGLLSAPTLHAAVLLGVAALIASLTAGLKAIQVFIPQLSFASLFKGKLAPYYVYADSFTRAFLAALVVALVGWLAMPTLNFSHGVVLGLLVGAFAAGLRAVQGLFTKGDVPKPAVGLQTPPPPAPKV